MKLFRLLLCILTVCLATADETRVLFIGNSYTAPLKKALPAIIEQSSTVEAEVSFITKGGFTLERHLANPATHEAIQNGNWDFVVLQEQSQTPALSGTPQASFYRSVKELCKLISESGATPVLYMTWGRRDGDQKNPEQFPDYTTMQRKLTAAYQQAARSNRAQLVPVGEVWSRVRQQDKALGLELYRKDGSHPSDKGTFLIASAFMKALFNDPLKSASSPAVSEHEARIIIDAVKSRR